jgi:hypothetical protein
MNLAIFWNDFSSSYASEIRHQVISVLSLVDSDTALAAFI